MKDILWQLFRSTGKVEYYMKYKELENEKNKSRENL